MIFVGIVLAVSLGTTKTSPVPAKVLAKYVLSLQPSHNLGGAEGLDEPHDLDIANGLESAESVYEPVRYRRPAFQEDPYYSAHHQEQLQQQYHQNHYQQQQQQQQQHQQQQQQQHQYDYQEPEDESDYGEADSETASANHHAYMTTYKTATRHGSGGRGYYSNSYGDSAEDEETSASEESPAVYEPIRSHKSKGKKHGSGGGTGSSSYSHYTHHHQQSPSKGSGHTSYHPQLIQAYKILHGNGGRLPTSHEDDRGSEEHRFHHVEDDDDDEDEDFRSGAAIGAAAGATGYGAPTGPQVIHTKGRAVPISQHVEIETPIPVPYVKKIHVPIPQEVKVRIPHPVLVPIPRPYPVHIPVAQPVAVPDIKEITVPIEKVVPYPVEKKIPVPIEKPVPYPIEKHVPVYLPQPIAVRVPIVKTIIHKVKQQTASGPTLPPAGGSFW
ncbi:probable serine/threonine-protein kinase kinX [Anopheles cruzii]|uniref:probable serine/threonine-protein kinase kinX n=1 Tax=Anopheles cruzii TaxID=68878 RepID=UPI0022EC7C55|nr:probable serine/threonine-protein kinase kinX [Anopheles cruzii]